METVDTLINARWVVPVEPACEPLADHAIALRNGRIHALLPAREAAARFEPVEVIDRPSHVVLHGFVNAHTHAAMTRLRGLADDLPLMQWLREHVWPAEREWVGAEFVADGVELAIAEMLRGGTTCFADMYFFPEVTARTAARLGMRAVLGMIVIDVLTSYAEHADDYLSKGLRLRDDYKGHPLISTIFTPHAPYTLSDESLLKVRRYADELDVPVQIHLHETADEVADSLAAHGRRPMARLHDLGLLSPLLMAVHMTQLEDSEIALAASTGISVIHCPESNLKLASGACPAAALAAAGVNVALGTDGAASNNDLDMLGETRSAALLGKHVAGDSSAMDAASVLRMATLNGARALGLGEETGSLVPGKWADVACVDLDRFNTWPVYDPVSQLVYAAGREQVTDVWVAGRHRVVGGRVAGVDANELFRRADAWRDRIAAFDRRRSGSEGA
jgi:5-methylthioadenosine/S-adenosylhomocysteine deaminase